MKLSLILGEPRQGLGTLRSHWPIPDPVPVPGALYRFSIKENWTSRGSVVLVGFETLKYYSERQNAHSQTGNASGGSEKAVG